MNSSKPAATIVIATRNRREELRQVLQSARVQSVPVEILVMDDGSTDGTDAMVTGEFPDVAYHRLATNRGPTFQRNRGVEMARCEIVFCPDDDCVFVSPHTVEQTLKEFNHPSIGAVGIPYVNVNIGPEVLQSAPERTGIWAIHAFVGCAHAVLRSAFLEVGGYREEFFYMGEEGELCLRLAERGWITRAGSADAMHHLESAFRVGARADFYGRRNDLCFAWHNVPTRWLLVHLLATTWNGLRATAGAGKRWPNHARGMLAGWSAILRGKCARQAVAMSVYRVQRAMKKTGPKPLEEVLAFLPPVPIRG
ncbi:glycosyltransferase [Roseimicrobium sp. ORNL1]|uniref:glycosyltransferase family 2 protein n=1 Tax=Roseimicrobium sp. ORNL1 TaxID=2711231 RepID=UPI0013E15FF9|nr:glycosyltransferase [Roseimicrobium sp. ORNL1]QIF05402.1 glycosyltransferase [Roseimicrobium sp. ORNL1]